MFLVFGEHDLGEKLDLVQNAEHLNHVEVRFHHLSSLLVPRLVQAKRLASAEARQISVHKHYENVSNTEGAGLELEKISKDSFDIIIKVKIYILRGLLCRSDFFGRFPRLYTGENDLSPLWYRQILIMSV